MRSLMLKRAQHNPWVRHRVGRLIGIYLSFALRSTRWTIDAPASSWPLMLGVDGQTAIVVFWHEFLPLVPALWWHVRAVNPSLTMTVLISRHRDGRMITEIVQRWGVGTVAGSSGRAGPRATRHKRRTAALRSLLSLLRTGSLIAITPDGPRGPRRMLQPGVARLAGLSGIPVIAAAASCRPACRLGSWDRMVLPLPFGRGRIVCSAPMPVAPHGWRDALPAIASVLDQVAREAGDEA